MASSFRRIAKDLATLQSALPPNFLFPPPDDTTSLADDLTQLVVLVAGPDGTPYAQGLWRLHLKLPADYPASPPKATFKTRIYHPNVDEVTGAVCLETLKRDWDPKLTLKHILLTISCLLIQPNPDSALNAAAGALIQENYDVFSAHARLMTSIHAPIPNHLHAAVQVAKLRGEGEGADHPAAQDPSPNAARRPEPRGRGRVEGGTIKPRANPPCKRPLSALTGSDDKSMSEPVAADGWGRAFKSPRIAPDFPLPSKTPSTQSVGAAATVSARDGDRVSETHRTVVLPSSDVAWPIGGDAANHGGHAPKGPSRPRVGIRRL